MELPSDSAASMEQSQRQTGPPATTDKGATAALHARTRSAAMSLGAAEMDRKARLLTWRAEKDVKTSPQKHAGSEHGQLDRLTKRQQDMQPATYKNNLDAFKDLVQARQEARQDISELQRYSRASKIPLRANSSLKRPLRRRPTQESNADAEWPLAGSLDPAIPTTHRTVLQGAFLPPPTTDLKESGSSCQFDNNDTSSQEGHSSDIWHGGSDAATFASGGSPLCFAAEDFANPKSPLSPEDDELGASDKGENMYVHDAPNNQDVDQPEDASDGPANYDQDNQQELTNDPRTNSNDPFESPPTTPRQQSPISSRYSPSHAVFLFRPMPWTPEINSSAPFRRSSRRMPFGDDIVEHMEPSGNGSPTIPVVQLLPNHNTADASPRDARPCWRRVVPQVASIVALCTVGLACVQSRKTSLEFQLATLRGPLEHLESSLNHMVVQISLLHQHAHLVTETVRWHLQDLGLGLDAEKRLLQDARNALVIEQWSHAIALRDIQETLASPANEQNRSINAIDHAMRDMGISDVVSWKMAFQNDVAMLASLQSQLSALKTEAMQMDTCIMPDVWRQWTESNSFVVATPPNAMEEPKVPPRPFKSLLIVAAFMVIGFAACLLWIIYTPETSLLPKALHVAFERAQAAYDTLLYPDVTEVETSLTATGILLWLLGLPEMVVSGLAFVVTGLLSTATYFFYQGGQRLSSFVGILSDGDVDDVVFYSAPTTTLN
ncbi:Aste57867_14921 [Aphanomyces stellatus]|uniref:Aste57867_14921 protein n=1 Tax=Aphanomyces stellatus TaxID=120398 RepID=A0A485L2H0_9STRA|nr:hypothetical protein As57867_014865 [Aphanomyces stellatus]VFT91736.1 Aste57867_14921 [Aphanomyces stellatus]